MRRFLSAGLILLCAAIALGAPNSRIIGGTTANAGEFPFAAGVTTRTSNGNFFCAGALLTNQWIITAGQCVINAVSFTITLGGITVTGTESTRITVAAEEYYIHPDYNPNTLEADVGLIKLRLPIELTDYIGPINLPTDDLANYAVVVAIGWGQTNDQTSGLVANLQRVTLTVVSNEECRLTFGNQILDTMVCVDGNYNQGTCNGDSGGPLVQYILGNQPTIVGVSIFNSGNGCESTDPSGYTRITPYLDWINQVINP